MYRSVSCMMEYLLFHAMCHSLLGPEVETPGLELQSIARVEVICVIDIYGSIESNVALTLMVTPNNFFGVDLPHHGIHHKGLSDNFIQH